MDSIATKSFKRQIPALCGMIAPAWFLVALLVFAALRPDYSHLTKAVSELGSVGAPNATAWNLLGFGAVGLLVFVFACGLWSHGGARFAALLLAVSGLAFAAAGLFPADMNDLNSDATRFHILASLISLGAFAAALPALGWTLWKKGRRGFALVAMALGVAVILSLGLRETSMPPGLAQRINFMAYLVWVGVVAVREWGIAIHAPMDADGR
jgi:hypothetical membrane protein